jgi:hypothetical protein
MEMIEIQAFKKAVSGVHPNDPFRLDIYHILIFISDTCLCINYSDHRLEKDIARVHLKLLLITAPLLPQPSIDSSLGCQTSNLKEMAIK